MFFYGRLIYLYRDYYFYKNLSKYLRLWDWLVKGIPNPPVLDIVEEEMGHSSAPGVTRAGLWPRCCKQHNTQGSSTLGLAKFWVLFRLTSSGSMSKNSWKMMFLLHSFRPSRKMGWCKSAGVGGKVGSPCFSLYADQPWQHVGLCLKVFPYRADVLTHSFLTPFVSLATQHSRA